jgi:hypothetical protein
MQSGQIRVGSLRSGWVGEPGWLQVRCDRSSVLGNPFELKKECDRLTVCQAYDEWLNENLVAYRHHLNIQIPLETWKQQGLQISPTFKNPTSRQVSAEMMRIFQMVRARNNVYLMCWCSPRACHCDKIAARILQKLEASA